MKMVFIRTRDPISGIEIPAHKQIPSDPTSWGRGGGLPTEGMGAGGASGPKDKPDTDDQPYLTMPYTS